MTSKQDRKRYLKLFARDQDYKDRLLKLQSQKLIDDLQNAEEVKNLQSLLTDNQHKLEILAADNDDIISSLDLIKELSYQVGDMQNQLTVHKRKLVAYREAAKKFKSDLDKAELRKNDFLKEVGMYEEYVSIQSAVKLTSNNKASEKTAREFAKKKQKKKSLSGNDKDYMESITINVEPIEPTTTEEPNTITLFSEKSNKDDLSLIKGIGPKFQILLNNEGIYTFEQIANWTYAEVRKRDKRLVFRGRVQREKWVDQAKALLPDNED